MCTAEPKVIKIHYTPMYDPQGSSKPCGWIKVKTIKR